jgi:hypothetical protein
MTKQTKNEILLKLLEVIFCSVQVNCDIAQR